MKPIDEECNHISIVIKVREENRFKFPPIENNQSQIRRLTKEETTDKEFPDEIRIGIGESLRRAAPIIKGKRGNNYIVTNR